MTFIDRFARLLLKCIYCFVIWLYLDLKDSPHLHIQVIVALTHLSKINSY